MSLAVVHLELHTHDLAGASAFYGQLLGWHTERIEVRDGSYHALALGGGLDGEIVERGPRRATWLPYAEVEEIEAITDGGRRLGASVLLESREGPAGGAACWARGGEIALWRPKRRLVMGTR